MGHRRNIAMVVRGHFRARSIDCNLASIMLENDAERSWDETRCSCCFVLFFFPHLTSLPG